MGRNLNLLSFRRSHCPHLHEQTSTYTKKKPEVAPGFVLHKASPATDFKCNALAILNIPVTVHFHMYVCCLQVCTQACVTCMHAHAAVFTSDPASDASQPPGSCLALNPIRCVDMRGGACANRIHEERKSFAA